MLVRCGHTRHLSDAVGRRGAHRPLSRRHLTASAAIVMLGAVTFVLTATPAAAQAGHDHGSLSLPFVIGPLALRVGLLGAIPAIAGFAVLRPFLPDPSRRTTRLVVTLTAGAVLLELMLAGNLDMPSQAAVALLAAIAVPVVLAVSRQPHPGLARNAARMAPWMVSLAAAVAFLEFGRGWLDRQPSATTATLLHTGLVVGLTGLAWFTLAGPRSTTVRVVVSAEAAALAILTVAAMAHATTLWPPPLSP